MATKQTLAEAGYNFYKFLGGGSAVFTEIATGRHEIFAANKNHPSWGLRWHGTDWEFCRRYTEVV